MIRWSSRRAADFGLLNAFYSDEAAPLDEAFEPFLDARQLAMQRVLQNDFAAACEELTKQLTDEEKMVIRQKYGLSPQNFMMVKNLDQKMQEQVTTVMANANAKVEELRWGEDAAKTNAIIQKIFQGDDLTEKELAQSQLLLDKLNGEKLSQLQDALNNSFAWLAWKDRRDEQKRQLEQEQGWEQIKRSLEKDEGFGAF